MAKTKGLIVDNLLGLAENIEERLSNYYWWVIDLLKALIITLSITIIRATIILILIINVTIILFLARIFTINSFIP